MQIENRITPQTDTASARFWESPAVQQARSASTPMQQKAEQAAKDFESLVIGQLLNSMKDSVGQWGFEQDGATQQMQGVFWMHLAQEVGNQGGVGLWKDIAASTQTEPLPNPSATLDISL